MTENDVLAFNPQDLEVFKEKPKNSGNPLIYHARPSESVSKDGIYRSTIRVLYNPFDLQNSILEQQSYYMRDDAGYFSVVSSLTNNDRNCPIFKAWKTCHFAPENSPLWLQAASKDKGGKQMFDKRYSRYALIQIVEDENQPDVVGELRFFKLPSSIWDNINGKMNPSVEDKKKTPIPVMDFLFGRTIDIEVKPGPKDPAHPERETREIAYSCEISNKASSMTNPDDSAILNAEQQAIAEKYIKAMSDRVWDEKDPEARAAAQAEINADANTVEFRKIYSEVLEKIKAFAPNLIEELGYKDWTHTEIAPRVTRWINNVLALKDPTVKPEDVPAGVESVGTATAAPEAPAANPVDSDLPF